MALQYVGKNSRTSTPLSLTALTGGIDTAARENDIVVYLLSVAATSDLNLAVTTTGYTEIADLYANDSNDANISVGYKIMGSTPDTEIAGPAGPGYALLAHVWRGVDTSNPMDVTPTTATGINGGVPTPPPITPTTAGAIVLCLAGNGASSTLAFTISQLSNLALQGAGGGQATTTGIGSFAWSSGTFTPTAWGGGTTSTLASYAAVTLALRPAANPIIDIAATDTIDLTSTSSLTRIAEAAGTANIALGFDALFVDVAQIAATATVDASGTSAMQVVEQIAAADSIDLTATASMVTVGSVVISAAADIILTGASSAAIARRIAATATVALTGAATLRAVSSFNATDTITLTSAAAMTLLWEPGSATSGTWSQQSNGPKTWTDATAGGVIWS